MSIKTVNVISSLNLSSGGPSLSTWNLVTGIRKLGLDARILTFNPGKKTDIIIGDDLFVTSLPSPRFSSVRYSAKLHDFILNNSYDLYHGHGLWQYPVHAMAKVACKMHKPYIISPRGMLHPVALRQSSFKKKIALNLFQFKDLESASVIHVTSNQELNYVREFGLGNSVALIPNSINIPAFINNQSKTNRRRVGFIGRFAPIKNIEVLLKAWSLIEEKFENTELVIVGDGLKNYKDKLIALCHGLKIKRVVFVGFLTGEERENVFDTLSYLVLPSKSENFGMVVPEALAREVPVIASTGTPWEELNTHYAGWWIDIGVEPLVMALNEALSLPESERQEMGKNGRKLVEQKYSIDNVARQMITLYEWILGKGPKPDFVYI
jgi:glycosyltransferase involved in cell wall biosynthesis